MGEFYDCVDGYNDRLRDQDYLHHILGNYVAVGMNNPKKYPKTPALKEEETGSFASDEALEAYIKAMANETRKA